MTEYLAVFEIRARVEAPDENAALAEAQTLVDVISVALTPADLAFEDADVTLVRVEEGADAGLRLWAHMMPQFIAVFEVRARIEAQDDNEAKAKAETLQSIITYALQSAIPGFDADGDITLEGVAVPWQARASAADRYDIDEAFAAFTATAATKAVAELDAAAPIAL